MAHGIVDRPRKLHCTLPMRLETHTARRLARSLDHDPEEFIGKLILKLLTPLEQTCAFLSQHIEDARILKLVSMLEPV